MTARLPQPDPRCEPGSPRTHSYKVLVCGSRTWGDIRTIRERLWRLPRHTLILTGGAVGADCIAHQEALAANLAVRVFKADWKGLGKRAGVLRNLAMLDVGPDLVIAFWDGQSRGTNHTITEARRRGIPVEIHGTTDTHHGRGQHGTAPGRGSAAARTPGDYDAPAARPPGSPFGVL